MVCSSGRRSSTMCPGPDGLGPAVLSGAMAEGTSGAGGGEDLDSAVLRRLQVVLAMDGRGLGLDLGQFGPDLGKACPAV
jgi:hypothetical protein